MNQHHRTVWLIEYCNYCNWAIPHQKRAFNENQTEYNPESASDSFCIPPSLGNLFISLFILIFYFDIYSNRNDSCDISPTNSYHVKKFQEP